MSFSSRKTSSNKPDINLNYNMYDESKHVINSLIRQRLLHTNVHIFKHYYKLDIHVHTVISREAHFGWIFVNRQRHRSSLFISPWCSDGHWVNFGKKYNGAWGHCASLDSWQLSSPCRLGGEASQDFNSPWTPDWRSFYFIRPNWKAHHKVIQLAFIESCGLDW